VHQWAGKNWKRFRVGFHDCNLADNVENAYQALAIDERRGPFRPAIWDKITGQRSVMQVWFAGVHSSVGGGYPDAGLSDTALTWMVNRARECGLVISGDYMNDRVSPDPLGRLEDSYSTAYKILEYLNVTPYARPIGTQLKVGEMIDASVVQRLQAALDPLYRPENIVRGGGTPQLISEGHNQFLQVGLLRVPVFRERDELRYWADETRATIARDGQAKQTCRIIDFTRARGARLRLEGRLQVGDRVELESQLTGKCESVVVWERDDEVGVRFVA
jgi:hypothetical protein